MEKRILFQFILLLIGLGFSPLQLKAQLVNNGAQVTIVNKGVLYVDGDLINQRSNGGVPNFSACLGPQIIVTGNIINNSGAEFFFSSDSSLVVMKGSSLQLIQGTDSINFFRLQIENTSDSVKLERSISVIDSLMMQSGYVNLNGHDINLDQTGYLTGETANTFIFGDSGSIYLQLPISMNSSPENFGGLGAFIQTNVNLGQTSITRSHQAQNVANISSGFRYFDIFPTLAVADNTLVFNYFDHELNGIAENDLQLYHSLDNGQTWTIQNALKNTSLNTLKDSTSRFSARYTMADDVCKLNPMVVDLGNDTALCIGDSISLNALNVGSDFIWSNNATTQTIKVVAGNYHVTVTSASGCTGIDSILVSPNPQPIVQTSNDTVVCSSQPLVIGDLNAGLPNTNSYLWNTGATTQTISVNTTSTSIDTFIYTVTTPAGCSITDSIQVEIINQPIVDLGSDTALCQTESLTLNATNAGATYLWSTGATTPSIQVNSTSLYSVTVSNGICQAIDTINVIKSNLISSTQKTDIDCNGNTTGTAEVTGLNGITPYSYVWNTNATTKAISNLAAGKYYATITDSIGCSIVSDTMEFFEPIAITLSFAVSNESCNTGNDGSIDLTATGGTGILSYNWNGGVLSEDRNNLTAGKYIVTVTDANNCKKIDSVNIIRPNGFTSTENFTNISCNGANDAKVNYSLSGGSAPFTFTWSNGSGDSLQTNLSAGTYSVLILDANNCSFRDTVIVINPNVISSSLVGTNLTCFNNGSGSINLNASGGTGALTFNWSNGAVTEDISNLAAAKYLVSITDGNGCQKVDSTILTEPLAITSSLAANAVSCNGSSDGTISSTVNGGTLPYTYLWSNGLTTSSITNLIAGKYLVTISDFNACLKLDSVVISEPVLLTVILDSSSNITCFGLNDGRIYTSTLGGTSPYMYRWNNTAAIDDLSNLVPGNYQLIVTDANGCSDSLNTTIAEPVQLTTSINSTNISCNSNSDGSIDLSINGGTIPYTYLWSNATTTEDLTAVAAGNYKVTITDANGCLKLDSILITEPAVLGLILTGTNVNCYNGTNGFADLTVSGGTSPFTYLWSDLSTSQDISVLTAANYRVTVTDANSCSKIDSIVITQPDSLTITSQITPALCFGSSTGAIDLTIAGGTSVYSFMWSNAISIEDLSNVQAGIYQVTVTDQNACSKVESFTITENSDLIVSTTVIDANCNQSDGAATATAAGGITPYTYLWRANGVVTPTNSSLIAGNYTVIVTDGVGCQDSAVASVGNISGPSITLDSSHNVDCFGDSSGFLNITVSGGALPYTYAWSNGATIEDIMMLSTGTYNLNVTDNNNCVAVQSYSITQGDSIQIALLANHVSCFNAMDGAISSNLIGGSGSLTYSWSNLSVTANLSNLDTGKYVLILQDSLACSAIDSIQISQPDSVEASLVISNVTCNGLLNGGIDLTVIGGTGTYTYNWSNLQVSQDLAGIASGKYMVTISDGNGCSIVDSAIVTEPMLLVYTDSVTSINCGGDSSGAVIISVLGGTSPYTYNWTNGESTATIDTLKIGTYAVTITDNNGCSLTNSYTITQPTAFSLFVSSTDITCNGLANGTATASVIGGSGPRTFVWSNSLTTASVSNLTGGKYYVTATDSLGCTQIDSVNIIEPIQLTATSNASNLSCNGDFSGSIDLTVSGGTRPYTYLWSSSAITEDISNLAAAKYLVTITDGNNCQIIDSTTINQPDTIALVASIQQVLCTADSSGKIALTLTGGTQPYSYTWSNGASVDSISKLIAGTYSVTVVDANSCSEIANYQITEPSVLSNLLNASTVSCGGDSTGIINSVVSGGVAPYSYIWSNGALSSSIQNLKSGTYYLTITDANACQLLDTASINQNSTLQALISRTDISCNGNSNGTFNLTVSGGTTPYSYLWNDLSTSKNRNNLNSGNYSVTVSDNLGCSVVLSDSIVEPSTITVLAVTNNVTCSGAGNASIKLSISGGVAPYFYNWSNSATTDSIGGLAGGTYLVTITDQNSCSTTRSYSLVNPDPIQLNSTVANIGCGSSEKGGSIRLAATGGTTPYSYNWTNSESSAIIDSLAVGNYSVTLTDALGCVSIAGFTIQLEGNPIFARYLSASFATSDDIINFVNLSYPSPASYTWDMGDSTILNQIDVLHSYRSRRIIDGDSSFYDVRLLADNGTCVDSVNKRITIRNLGPLRKRGLDSISRYDAPFIEEVNLYPVPAKNVLNYKLLLGLEDEMTVRIYSLEQKLLKTYSLSKAKEHEGILRISELSKGMYIITFATSTDQQSIRFIKM